MDTNTQSPDQPVQIPGHKAHMPAQKVILVTGGTGLVGRAVQYISEQEPRADERWVFIGSKDADLLSAESTNALFARVRPTHVLHLAARVGGLFANMVCWHL